MSDRAQRLADIEAREPASCDLYQDTRWLLAEIRDADAALVALGIPDDGRPLAERIASLGEERDMARGLNEAAILRAFMAPP